MLDSFSSMDLSLLIGIEIRTCSLKGRVYQLALLNKISDRTGETESLYRVTHVALESVLPEDPPFLHLPLPVQHYTHP